MKPKRGRPAENRHLKLVKEQYTLCYGMRLDKGTAPERRHPHVPVTLPDGSEVSMSLHVINGTVEEIKAQLMESVDAFFEIYGEPRDD
jgi:hypothetical protein